jgi:hypothetical protein
MKMYKWLVIIDMSEAYRGYAKPLKVIVSASGKRMAAIKALKKINENSINSSDLQSDDEGYYVDGYGTIDITKIR